MSYIFLLFTLITKTNEIKSESFCDISSKIIHFVKIPYFRTEVKYVKMIWKEKVDIKIANQFTKNTLVNHLGIEFTEVGDNYLAAKMPVDKRTVQPFGILHGGASVSLAETVGSFASNMIAGPGTTVVGVEINANHLKAATKGYVHAKAIPVRLGRKLHVWNIEIRDDEDQMVCISRLTTMLIEKK